ncbi:MAG: Npt1/Npt2 family nucleotide transporter [Verrucomicrobiota bacterium]|jgi:AAA family ATP:ADP antiporter|nr:Npt1/Npt2 family nucleotide transporter [Verrucomicrobiota bacterium]MDP6753538.1 Npt1/Npt2 family nucleotide transporter [Verrucomicrobiota bacterium]
MPNAHFSTGKKIAFTAVMFLYINLVLTIFWILKPLKKTLFIGQYDGDQTFKLGSLEMLGSSAELLAKGMNLVIAFLIVLFLTLVTRLAKRQRLTYCCMGLVIAMTFLFTLQINQPTEMTVWLFYWFGDLYISLMLAAFFSFLHDTVDLKNAKRLYGFIVLGAVSGGAVGSTYFRGWIAEMNNQQWLHTIIGIGVVICALAFAAGWMARSIPHHEPEPKPDDVPGKKFNAAIEGASLVFKSRYLIAIAGIVGFYEITSEVLDYQFTAMTERFVPKEEIGSHFGTVYAIGNIGALVIQLGFSIFAANFPKYRIHWILLALPLSIAFSSLFFILVPVLVAGSLLKISDSTFAYSVNQTGRETLYNPLSRQEKYVARAFVEVFVQRTGKVAALFIALLVPIFLSTHNEAGQLETSLLGLQLLGGFTCIIVALWFYCVKIVGRKFESLEREQKSQAEPDTAPLGQAQEQPSPGTA